MRRHRKVHVRTGPALRLHTRHRIKRGAGHRRLGHLRGTAISGGWSVFGPQPDYAKMLAHQRAANKALKAKKK